MIHNTPVAVEQDTRQVRLSGALNWYLQHQGEIERLAGQGDGVARAVLDAFKNARRYTESTVDAFVQEVEKYRHFKAC